jgi:nucleotide-binding universal stress UspA family protein
MNTIIVATDFSDVAFNAAQYAAYLTRYIPVNKMILYHSYYDLIATDTPLADTEYYSQLQEDSLRRLTDLKGLIKLKAAEGIIIECVANMSSLRDAVCSDFVQENAELVVMGATGKSGLKGKIFGSQAVISARYTRIPLLLIPFNATFQKIEKIVLAWNMKNSEQTFPEEIFKNLLQELKAGMLILNIDHNNQSFSEATIREQEFMHHLVDAQQAEFFYGDHPDVAQGIIDFAKKRHADMVMVVPRKNAFPENLIKKRVTQKLVFHLKIPLMILPSKQQLIK